MEGTIKEFECARSGMVEICNLHEHNWVIDIYAKCSRYVKAYLKVHFFVGMKALKCVKG